MALFSKVVNGPGELDLALNILRRQRTVPFWLSGECENARTLFSECVVRSVRCLTDRERRGKFGMNVELLVETSDWPDPEVTGFRCLYFPERQRGEILEVITKKKISDDCAKAS